MIEFFLSKNVIIVYEIIIVLILFFILFYQMKKNKKFQERKRINEEKMRYIRLDEKLKNPDMKSDWANYANPFEIQYSQQLNSNMQEMPKYQIEIEVRSKSSIRKYLFDLDKEITIGGNPSSVLFLNDNSISNANCSIFLKNQMVYLKHYDITFSIRIQRGKRKKIINNQMLQLQNKDILTIGENVLYISIYKN